MTDATTTPTDRAGEPVAWQRRKGTDGWLITDAADVEFYRGQGQEIRALYTHPQPSLSVGLDREAVALRVANAMLEYAPLDRDNVFSKRVKLLGEISNDAADALLALAAPAEGYVLVPVEKLEDIVALSGFLRQGGCDAEDLAGLEYAVEAAVDIASDLLPAAPTGGRS